MFSVCSQLGQVQSEVYSCYYVHACACMECCCNRTRMSVTAVSVSTLCVVLEIVVLVQCQPYPHLVHNRVVLSNNSFIRRGSIGVGDDALMCVTDYTTECCASTGNWTDETGGAVHQGTPGESEEIGTYVTRGAGVVSLNRNTGGGRPGMWRCDIPDSSGVMQSMYIYTGTTGSSGRGESVECFLQTISLPLFIRSAGLSIHLLHCPSH